MKAQLWWYEQIFQFEQFAQGADHLDSFFLVANRAKPLIDVPPWRRPSEPHGALNEVTGLGERAKCSWFRRVLDHEGRIDTKVEHAQPKLAASRHAALMGVKTHTKCRHGGAAAMLVAYRVSAPVRRTRWQASAIRATCRPWYRAASISSADGMRAPSAPTMVVAP